MRFGLTYHIDILYDILKRWMTPERFKDVTFVEQSVHQIGTVDKLMCQT